MSLLKYIQRVKTIHELIEKEKTGTSKAFSEKLGISRSILMEHLREFREDFKAPVFYCRKRQTFYYGSPYRLSILINAEMEKVKGGGETHWHFTESDNTRLITSIFDSQYFLGYAVEYAQKRK